ncbi:MAG: hypothetical protein AseanaTS_29270 [Candidatus Pelagadaptatus aseana]|uniref:efflux RND transporter permease subunit n=1 Tax=Candidatus Pelagadaptatus aseana TaxID=3120508 RepID=UPI0039B339C0
MYQAIKQRMIHYALNHPKTIIWAMVLSTLTIVGAAALPSLWPQQFPQLHALKVDTDPENMLSADEPVRVFHDHAKERFNLHDMVVVGLINHQHPQGIFNKDSLTRVYQLTEFAKSLQWLDDNGNQQGVVRIDLMAPSTVDNIEQGGLGSVNFSWLMPAPPQNDAEALAVLQRAQKIPFLNGTLVSEDGQALALYLPITSKDTSYRIRNQLLSFTQGWEQSGDEVHITGLPVAEDTFGVEMFIQMAISAPLAMLLIFALLWWFFKRLILVVSPMVLAMVCSLATMGLLIISGNTLHIMSSMIPIFIMPIAVLDAVHILSEFFDVYPKYKDRRKTIEHVLNELFAPMLFTTLTTMAGFASLMLTPIPPVQVFGLYIAIGVFLAWLWTMLFIPAYIMSIDEARLEGYGADNQEDSPSPLNRLLSAIGNLTQRKPGWILAISVVVAIIAGFGISKINVNDNPTRWFEAEHPIRVADRVLNHHFGGTYMAYLEFSPQSDTQTIDLNRVAKAIATRKQQGLLLGNTAPPYDQAMELLTNQGDWQQLTQLVDAGLQSAEGDDYYSWDDLQLLLDEERQRGQIFKQPEVLRWLEQLQAHMLTSVAVGKVNSLTDVTKTVFRELQLGDPAQFRIPDSANAVGQTLITYQNSHRPHDLWHFVTPDFRHSVMWLQLTSGDNQDMEQVVEHFNHFVATNPAPQNLQSNWFGLTYINVIWQGKMVNGMMEAFLGSFAIVLAMMTLLFRSLSWGLLAMIPLTLTVGLIYGIIGLIGKDYDMPVAVLSALSLGLAVDYAIHFLARSRELVRETGSWQQAAPLIFGEPARAISRNAIILGAGFTPLLMAPLVPYQTVGVFIASIIISAAIATLLILPACLKLLQNLLFQAETEEKNP